MAASESNPTYLILGIVTFIVAFFFIGNIVACVSPARPRLHPSRSAALLNADARRSGNHPPRGSPPTRRPLTLTRPLASSRRQQVPVRAEAVPV